MVDAVGALLASIGHFGIASSVVVPRELSIHRRTNVEAVFSAVQSARDVADRLVLLGENARSERVGPKEFVWELDVHRRPTASGIPFESYVLLSFGLDFLPSTITDGLAQWIETLWRVACNRDDFLHGLADVGTLQETGRGRIYGSIEPGIAQFSARVRRLLWLRSGSKRGFRLRGVSWGQFLGPSAALRLGDIPAVIEDYNRLADPVNYDLVRLAPNGSLLIWLCRSPMVFCEPQTELAFPDFARAAWLCERFAAVGLL